MDYALIFQMGLTVALEIFKSLNKPLDQITYEDLKNFRSYEDVRNQLNGHKQPAEKIEG